MIRTRRIGLVHLMFALFALAILLRAGEVQLVQGRDWSARADRQQSTEREVPAPRGEILDGSHRVLAESHNMVKLAIAPNEVRDPGALARALTHAGVSSASVSRALDRRLKWVPLPKPFLAMDVAPALALSGVHATPVVERSYVMSEGTRRLVGRVNASNEPVDGLELALDSILRGHDGSATLLHTSHGQAFESPTDPGVAATPGSTVVLTINSDLQEIVERTLADAVSRLGADGGDIVVLDPFDGDILAMASQRSDPRSTSATALTEPFEPGSTMKPFIAAGLLQDHLVSRRDSVDTGNGVLDINGRVIHDDHRLGRVPLADVLRWSSNIGIVKFAERFSPAQEYETLRNFGFGSITGVPYPTESAGRLRDPSLWSRQSANSMAMGYEVSVTPLQLALAYATIANGGELLEPALVSEIIAPDGTVQYKRQKRVVRRVLSPEVANRVRQMLVGVVDGGTALSASIANYELAGKTGTPRGTVDGRYVAGRHNPNFAGIFPADAPQFVIVVKLTMSKGAGYSAETAAPVTRAVLQAAIASRDAALDRDKLASSALPPRDSGTKRLAVNVEQAGAADPLQASRRAADSNPVEVAPAVFTLPLAPVAAAPPAPERAVPDIHGLSLRDAVRSLHSAGFRIQLERGGPNAVAFTSPAAGALAPAGSLVRLTYSY